MANKNFEVKHGLSVGGTERITSAGAGSLTDLTLSGNLTVNGTTVTLDAATVQVEDKNIVLNYHASNDTSGTADGAGITIQDAVNSSTDATILWNASSDQFDFSHHITLPDSKYLKLGDDADFIIYHDGTTNYVQAVKQDSDIIFRGNDGGTSFNAMAIDMSAGGNVGIGTSSPSDKLHIVHDSSTTNDTVDVVRIEATSSGTPAVGFGPVIDFRGERAGASSDSMGRVGFVADVMTASRIDGAFVVETSVDGTYTEHLRITSAGKVGIGQTPGDDFEVKTDNSMSFVSDTSDSISFGTSGTNKPCIKFDTANTTHTNRVWAIENGAGDRLNFFRNGLDVLKLNQSGHVEIPNTFSAGNYPNGTSNVCLGSTAGGNFGSGNNYNVAIGDAALATSGTGDVNVAVGYHALRLNTSGYHNVAIGSSDNSSVGAPLGNNTEGRNNIAIGRGALEKNTTGISNTAVGDHALGGTTGQSNTASNNTAVGKDALNVTYGVDNTAIGKGAGILNTSGKRNLFVGIDAGAANTTQDENCFIGRRAGQNATVSQTTAVGTEALQNCTGNYNTAVGTQALMYNTNGVENTAVGRLALHANVSGDLNTAVGHQALDTLTGGDRNTAVGREALRDLGATGTPGNNTACGTEAGKLLTSGVQNTAVGSYAMNKNLTASSNTCIGYRAGENITSGANVFIGKDAARLATSTDTSVVIGDDAGTALTSGGNNVFIGRSAGDDIQSGGQNVIIGKLCDGGASGASGRMVIGYNASGSSNQRVTFGYGSNVCEINLDGSDESWAASSDERLKENVKDSTAGLSFINDLRPITYNWKKKKDVPEDLHHYEEDSNEPSLGYEYGKQHHGFIAQEVKEVIDSHPEVVEGQNIWRTGDDGIQKIAKGGLIPMLVKSIQELSEKVNELEEKLNGN